METTTTPTNFIYNYKRHHNINSDKNKYACIRTIIIINVTITVYIYMYVRNAHAICTDAAHNIHTQFYTYARILCTAERPYLVKL